MNRYQVTFKSGAQIEFDAEEFVITRGIINTSELVGLKWNNGESSVQRLKYIQLESIECIVEMVR